LHCHDSQIIKKRFEIIISKKKRNKLVLAFIEK
jgi:hypothetical protein